MTTRRNKLLLSLLTLLSSKRTTPYFARGQCYPVQIEVFESSEACQNGAEPAAVGTLYGDGTCRATQVIRSDSANRTYSFPGRYVASCRGADLEISDSGCTSADCSSANGADVCDRQFSPASYYSRLEPPVYQLAQDSSESFRFCMILSDSEGNDIVFTLVGDCTVPCEDRTAVPNSPPPSLTTPSPAPVLATEETSKPTTAAPASSEPTARPTVAPTTARPSTLAPAPEEEKPEPIGRPTVPTAGGDGGGTTSSLRPSSGRTPTKYPTLMVNPSVQEQQAASNSSHATAIIAGSIVGGALVVILVLVVGFVLGANRQRKKDASSSDGGAGSYEAEEAARKIMGHGGGPAVLIPAAVASTTATARTPPMFESTQIIIPTGHEDDVSTLGTPLGVSFLEETTTVGESSFKKENSNLLGREEEVAAIERTATEDSGDLFTTAAESKPMVFGIDDASFEQQFDTENEPASEIQSSTARASDAAVNESMHFVVTAPPGKLGMVIDDYFNVTGVTSPSSKLAGSTAGTPTVHALKDDSVLRQRGVRVGDLLETVDGVDVTDLNCLDVSRMITGKSSATRVLGFIRRRTPSPSEE